MKQTVVNERLGYPGELLLLGLCVSLSELLLGDLHAQVFTVSNQHPMKGS